MFKNAVLSVALLASQAYALAFIGAPTQLVAGQTVHLQWDVSTPVTLVLRKGDPANLDTIATIADGVTGGSYYWTVPATFAPGVDYALEIKAGTESNYVGSVVYTGGVAASVAASPSAVASASGASAVSVAPVASGSAKSAASAAATTFPTLTPLVGVNGTSSTRKPSSSSTSAAPKPSGSVVSANSAVAIGSPLALVLGAVAAMLYLQ